MILLLFGAGFLFVVATDAQMVTDKIGYAMAREGFILSSSLCSSGYLWHM